MQRISQAEYDDLTRDTAVLSADQHGPKVLLRPDGRVIKLFRRKRLLSSTLLRPYARRFEAASRQLARRGIIAAQVQQCRRVPSIRRDLVVYPQLEGTPLRHTLADSEHDRDRLMPALAKLMALLHECGVYFRAAHFGNLLVQSTDNDEPALALIDLSEARFQSRALSPAMRARNFRPLTRYPEDLAALQSFGVRRFLEEYLAAARLNARDRDRFMSALHNVHRALAAS